MPFSISESLLAHPSDPDPYSSRRNVEGEAAMGRVAVVTGAASGIGLAIARRLAAGGDRVGVFDIDAALVEQAAAAIREAGGEAVGVRVDVSDRASVDAALEVVRGDFGPVLVMVTSAGVAPFERFLDISLESWQGTMAVKHPG